MKSFLYFGFFAVLVSNEVIGQGKMYPDQKKMIDSIKKVYIREAAVRSPALRQVVISTDLIADGTIRSKLYGNNLFDGTLSQIRTSALVNVPVHAWGKNKLTASFSFFHQHLSVMTGKQYMPDSHRIPDTSVTKLTVGLSASYQRVDSLFGRRVIYTGSLSVLADDYRFAQKVSFIGGMIFQLKQTRNTNISLGMLLNIDPSVDIPVLPLFIYWHKFKNDVELDINLPQRLLVRKALSKRSWVYFGTSMAGSVSFFRFSHTVLPADVSFSSVDLKTGPGVDFRLNKLLMIGANTGVLTPITSRQFERNESSNKYFLSNRISTIPYLNVTVSLLPFL